MIAGLMGFIERKIAPSASKIASQKHIKAIQSTFLTLIPFYTIGSFSLIIISPPVESSTLGAGFGRSFFQGWEAVAEFTRPTLSPIFTFTMGSMALYVVAALAFYLARHHKMQTFVPIALTLACFLILVGPGGDGAVATGYFGGTGLFTALVAGIVGFESYRFMYERRFGRIELSGSGVPPALTESLASLVPILFVLLGAGTIGALSQLLASVPFPELITVVMSPIVSGVDTVWAVALLALIVGMLWWFGIHDSVITGPLNTFLYSNIAANATAFAGGTAVAALPFVLTHPFWWTFMAIGGSGATLGLAFLALWSKSRHIKTVGRLSAVPALFNINEPLIFGLPIMYNPVLFIPFTITMSVNGVISYLLMDSGIISLTFADAGWNMFAPVGALIATLDFKAVLLVLGLIVLDALIYLPFFKVFERQKLAEERAESAATAEQADMEAGSQTETSTTADVNARVDDTAIKGQQA